MKLAGQRYAMTIGERYQPVGREEITDIQTGVEKYFPQQEYDELKEESFRFNDTEVVYHAIPVAKGEHLLSVLEKSNLDSDAMYYINGLRIHNQDGDFLDIDRLLLDLNCRLLISRGRRYTSLPHCGIIVVPQLFTPSDIMVVLHEIGHQIVRASNQSEINQKLDKIKIKSSGDQTKDEAKEIIDNERSAWAWALHQIKPFLTAQPTMHGEASFTIEDAHVIIHDLSLKSRKIKFNRLLSQDD